MQKAPGRLPRPGPKVSEGFLPFILTRIHYFTNVCQAIYAKKMNKISKMCIISHLWYHFRLFMQVSRFCSYATLHNQPDYEGIK